jgi:hypothetical protein
MQIHRGTLDVMGHIPDKRPSGRDVLQPWKGFDKKSSEGWHT